jgi:hypothetical protein
MKICKRAQQFLQVGYIQAKLKVAVKNSYDRSQKLAVKHAKAIVTSVCYMRTSLCK